MRSFPMLWTFFLGLVALHITAAEASVQEEIIAGRTAAFEGDYQGDDVTHINDESFATEMKTSTYYLLYFHAPWCQQCETFTPEFHKVAKELRDHTPPIKFGMIDVQVNTVIKEAFNLKSLPIVKVIKRGVAEDAFDYRGRPTADAMVAYLKKITGDASVLVTAETVEESKESALKERGSVMVGIFPDLNSVEFRHYLMFAEEKAPDMQSEFLHYVDPEAGEASLKLYKAYDKDVEEVFKGDWDSFESMAKWYKLAQLKLLVRMGPDANKVDQHFTNTIFDVPLPKIFGFYAEDGDKEPLEQILTASAEKYRDKHLFGMASAVVFEEPMKHWGVEAAQAPMVLVHVSEAENYVAHKLELTEAALDQVVADFEADNLYRVIKSQPIPSSQPDAHQIEIVGDNFVREVVKEKSKDVVMYFYTDGCTHCATFEGILKKVASSLYNDKDYIKVVRMDHSKNDISSKKVEGLIKGYPAIVMKTSKGDYIGYDGDRSFADVVVWVREAATAQEKKFEL